MPGPVNRHQARRRYDATGRQARAAQRREAVLEAARRRFLTEGYASTTVAAVAADADVSPESVYTWFRSKAGLLKAVWDLSLAGSGPTHAEQRSDAASVAAADGAAIVRSWARLSAEVGAVADPIYRIVERAAYADAEVAELQTRIETERARRMEHNAAYLADGGHLRPDVSREQARDVLLLYSTLYDRLVNAAGWTPSQLSDFVERGLTAHLLP